MQSNRVIVVLGSGRSGTSLVMQLLHALGMQVSENLTEASVANPLGPFEDKEIFDLHSSLIHALGGHVSAPMPDGWLQNKVTIGAIRQLGALIKSRLENVEGLFGFKDPKTSMLIPLWVRVFNNLKLTPAYILAVRDPSAMVASFLRHYDKSAYMAELIWLVRMVEALENTAADCFVAHYEDWFAAPKPLAQGLLHYTGLNQYFKGDLSEVVAQTVKPNLNRASKDDYEIKNPYVLNLYEVLKECHGAEFDRNRVMAVVKECRKVIDSFKDWYQLACQVKSKNIRMEENLKLLNSKLRNFESLEKHMQLLRREKSRNDYTVTQIDFLQQALEHLVLFENNFLCDQQ